jgi:hypothetical protein
LSSACIVVVCLLFEFGLIETSIFVQPPQRQLQPHPIDVDYLSLSFSVLFPAALQTKAEYGDFGNKGTYG